MDRNPVLLYKTLVVGVILLLLCISITPSVAIDNVKKSTYSIGSGNILYVGGSGEGNYTKIKDAVDNASDGDTVFVFDDSSPYYENVLIGKTIKLIGENRNSTIIDGGEVISTIILKESSITISGFTIRKGGEDHNGGGIKILSAKNVISNNIITDNKYGIISYDQENDNANTISNNIITKNGDGIWANEAYIWEISNNEIFDNGNGINIRGANTVNIRYNNIYSNRNRGIDLWDPSECKINNNIFSNNVEYGIYSVYPSNCQINNNIFSNNGYGFRLSCTIKCKISYNVFSNNAIGLSFYNRGYVYEDNIVSCNNFIDNKKQVVFFVPLPRLGHRIIHWLQNYWSDNRFFKPYFIPGELYLFRYETWGGGWNDVTCFWVSIDLRSAKEPYDIEV